MNTYDTISLLIGRCKRGDTEAQFAIYKLFYRAMFNTALRIIGHKEEAEDVMQECFLQAFDKLNELKDDAFFAGWLKQMVVNKSLNCVRKLKPLEQEDFEHVLIVDEDYDAGEAFLSERKERVLGALKQVKDAYRIVLTLHYIEGYDLEEVCEIMQISYGNCRTLLTRAKVSIRQKLELYESA